MSRDDAVAGGPDRPRWVKLYAFDVVALLLSTFVTLRFWWSYFACHNIPLMTVAILCSSAETARRLLVAKRLWQRPATFFSDRRSDLLVGIVLGTGPWPILPVLEPSISPQFSALPMWLWLFALSGMLVIAARRLMIAVADLSHADRRSPIRQLVAVPDLHMASIFVMSSGVCR